MTNDKKLEESTGSYNILTDSHYLNPAGEPIKVDPMEESVIAGITELYHKMQQEESE